ncbi:MAG: hypothetical protein F6J94_00560 [Moorea sp. SIO1F2]|nr:MULTISPECIES: hypothetical protein [unclassified Moorena]NEO21289.1 hypothetical protein [Moorena sp. SIO4A5]NEP24669.1 hypothetical protein [Moorena sp. SIO3I6]NEQ60408.1 hypothetical protein [Moorena sp. SIO4A1]NET80531.1 hypothetical protein [Moorena sp. SIO1F2]
MRLVLGIIIPLNYIALIILIRYSQVSTPYSLLPTPYSLLPTPYSLLPTP